MKPKILKVEEEIEFVKQTFEVALKRHMSLTKVSAPIAILEHTGINDDLNGIERTVTFPIKALNDRTGVVVNSLAKWKRVRLQDYGIEEGEGILTDMRAIRPDEAFSNIHSIYVDQWDWEKRISPSSRHLGFLMEEVCKIYAALKETETKIFQEYDLNAPVLPDEIKFIHAEELLQLYPNMTPKERENEIVKKHGAVFLIGIGGLLSNEEPHDGRAPDYDDWSTKNEDGYFGLNGDILVWHPVLNSSFEISSMGIRVDKETLIKQLHTCGQTAREKLHFHQLILRESIPQSIGGGIGQSRVTMFMLRKKHIGEVQVGIWSDKVKLDCEKEGILLL